MTNNLREVLVAGALIVLALLLLNPFHFWMPDMMLLALLAVALVLGGAWASFVLREQVRDERDALHRALAGRNAFVAGAAILILALVAQGFRHAVDPWLVCALLAMIVAKLWSRYWSDHNL